jgi:hypothetical protein
MAVHPVSPANFISSFHTCSAAGGDSVAGMNIKTLQCKSGLYIFIKFKIFKWAVSSLEDISVFASMSRFASVAVTHFSTTLCLSAWVHSTFSLRLFEVFLCHYLHQSWKTNWIKYKQLTANKLRKGKVASHPGAVNGLQEPNTAVRVILKCTADEPEINRTGPHYAHSLCSLRFMRCFVAASLKTILSKSDVHYRCHLPVTKHGVKLKNKWSAF